MCKSHNGMSGTSLWQVLPGLLGSADKGPEEIPANPSHGLEDSQPLPIPHQGHLEKIGSSPIRIISHLCAPPGPSQPRH